MQQLKVEQNKPQQSTEEQEQIKREGKGRALAISRDILRIAKTDSFYCQSENNSNVYYFIRYAPDVLVWCSCPDSSMRQMKCKHIWACEYAIRMGTLKYIDRLPTEAKVRKVAPPAITTTTVTKPTKKSYTEDDYSF